MKPKALDDQSREAYHALRHWLTDDQKKELETVLTGAFSAGWKDGYDSGYEDGSW